MSYITNKAGITLDGGFKLDSAQPLDVRFVIASGEDKDELLASSCYAGMEVWDSNDNKKYRAVPKTGGGFEWKEVGTMEDIPDITFPDITVTDTGTKPIVGDITASGHTITVSRIGLDDLGLASAYKYKGSKDKYANLPTTGNVTGDVWNVTDTGMNYAWTGTAWDALGSIIDTSNFVTATKNTNVNVAGNTKDTYTYDKTAIFAPNGLIMGGTAAAAGLVTRGVCGVSTPDATTGAATKENLYINYDGDNNWNPNGRGVIINAGTAGTDLGSGMYQYAAVRGDIVKAWVEAKKYLTSHQSIKTLNTNNTTAQTASASEAIAGSGTINLHKISKTGSYNDLLNKPSIPDPSGYYWANINVSTSSSTSTKPTFAKDFLVNIANNNVLTPGADWAIASAIPKYLWHDLLPFRTAKAEYSTDGATWTEDATDTYRRTLTNQKENQTITVLSDSRPYARFTWDGGSAIWHACQADWLVIGFAYASPAATCSIKFQYSTDGTTWVDSLTVPSGSYSSAPSWFKINNSFSSCRAVRLVLTRTNSSGTLNLSSVKWLTKRWGNQGMGSELEKPYSWDNNANLYYRNSSSTLGLSSAPWSAIYGTTIYENGTSLASKYQPLDADLTAIAGLTGTSGFLKKIAADTWALDTNTYLTAESDTLQTVTTRGATTNKAITTAGLTTTSTLYITGTTGHREGIRIAPYGNLSSIWWNATGTQDYTTGQMWGITAYDKNYAIDATKTNTFRFRGPTSATATSATDQMWINTAGLVTARGGFEHGGLTAATNKTKDDYVLLAGGGTKLVSEIIEAGSAGVDLSGYVTGSGTANYIPKFTAAGAIGNSIIVDNGTNIYPKASNAHALGTNSNIWSSIYTKTIQLNRNKGVGYGYISFYQDSFDTWYEYMNDPASNSPTGKKSATLGDVTSWARRSLIESKSGYGWVWESCLDKKDNGNVGNTPVAKMALSSNSGNLTVTGSVTANGFKHSDATTGNNNYVLLAGGGTKAIDDITGTTYGADRGISLSNGNFGHSNTAVTAQSTKGLYKISYDAYGHITGTEAVTLPTVNNGTLTIQKNGTNVATFTANQSGNTTANITVPDPANYYWADIKISSTSSTATTPTVQKIGITGSTATNTAAAVTMEYDSSYKALKFSFA